MTAGKRGARGRSPKLYRKTGYPPMATRLPEDVRRLVDFVALGTGTSASMVLRVALERLLTDLGFPLVHGVTAMNWPDRARIEAWLAEHPELTDGAEPPGAAGPA